MKIYENKIFNRAIGVLYCICLILGYFGLTAYNQLVGANVIFINNLYHILQLFVMNTSFEDIRLPISLDIARFMAPALLAGTILNLIFTRMKESFIDLYVKLFFKNHVIFCGLGRKSYKLIDQYLGDKKVIVIEIDPNNPFFPALASKKLRIIMGSADNPKVLIRANILKACELFALTDKDEININLCKQVMTLYDQKSKSNRLKIILHLSDFENLLTFKNYQKNNFAGNKEKSDNPDGKGSTHISYYVFNLYEKAASYLVDKYRPDYQLTVDSKENPPMHVLVHGLNEIGQPIIAELAIMYHFANLKKTIVTIVDDNIYEKRRQLLAKFPAIESLLDINYFEFQEYWDFTEEFSASSAGVCFICCDNDGDSLRLAKRYRQTFSKGNFENGRYRNDENALIDNKFLEPKIVIYSAKDHDILNLFENIQELYTQLNISFFDPYGTICTKEIISQQVEARDQIARRIHDVYIESRKHDPVRESSQSWEKLSYDKKESNRYAARHYDIVSRQLRLNPDDKASFESEKIISFITEEQLEIAARLEHSRWVAEKLIRGYQTIAPLSEQLAQNDIIHKVQLHKDLRIWEELDGELKKEKVKMVNDVLKRENGKKVISG